MKKLNLTKKLDTYRKTEAAMLVLALQKAGLEEIRFNKTRPVISANPLKYDGGPIQFVINSIMLNEYNCLEFFGFDPEVGEEIIEDMKLHREDFFPGEISYLLDYIPGVDDNLSVAPRGIDEKIQTAISAAMDYLDNDMDCICDEDTLAECRDVIDKLSTADELL